MFSENVCKYQNIWDHTPFKQNIEAHIFILILNVHTFIYIYIL